ncbi:hypothetical protein SERLADRAFT_456323 [Serpula lacrymans var. lacrymans S7.9]|uniref:Uncharacterized protein n=1 Tax=Serpula lacrymans var. lacrymans (strain S7.9) TaxID=578457 RepID=F8NIW7_SERL9|nr:uncharacterized protein SERLADRAFT_456323 [Serpula lacrymans var. lacrymans S7.9]EGO29000.1 hypothetical protein SERLADRAFT_456323 [Serpula lacrymans var. lacrymans S7.9]
MSSMLYQRRVWHIDQPIIGIIFQGTGTVGQVLFGWLDHDSGTSGDLPGVHIACASPNSQPKASLGIFDLTDPVAAISLAQFVLGLSSYFKDLINATSVTSVDADPSLHWRSDLIDISSESGEQWKERVSRWACDVHVSTCASSDTSSSPPRTPPLHATRSQPSCWSPTMSSRNLHTIHEEGHDEPRGSKSLRSGVKRDGTQSDHKVSSDKSFSASQSSVAKHSVSKKSTKMLSTSKDKSPAGNQLSVDKYSASKESKTNVSNSSFAMKSENGLDEELSITNWLFDRRALTIGRILLADLAQDPESEHKEINEKIKFYDETTKFCWPSSWKTLSDLPGSDLSIEGHRRMLFENYNNYVQAGNEVPDLETKIMELLSSRFSSMLSSSDGAYTRALAAAKRNSNEAERRHDWDNLLLKFFTTSKYTGSTNRDVLLERVLNAPRNIALDAMRTSAADHVRERSKLARQYESHCRLADFSVASQALQALNQSASFVEQVKGDIEARLLDALERRTNQEPTRGKCDAILVVPLEGVCAKIVKILGQSEGRKFVKNLALIAHPGAEKSASGTGKNDRANSDSARHLTVEPQPSSVTDNSKSTSYPSLHNVFTATVPRPPSESSETLSKDVVQLQAAQDGEIDNDLLLPVLTAEYKKKDVTTTFKALNQSRMYTVSALYFLRSLGIVDFPLFGLVTSGSEGAVSMAWYSSKQQVSMFIDMLIDILPSLTIENFFNGAEPPVI